MAEGFLRALHGDTCDAASAGLQAFRVSRTAIRVMKEAGIDISAQRSKSIGELAGSRFDLVVTLCDEAACMPPFLLPPGILYPANYSRTLGASGGTRKRSLRHIATSGTG